MLKVTLEVKEDKDKKVNLKFIPNKDTSKATENEKLVHDYLVHRIEEVLLEITSNKSKTEEK